MVWFVKKSTYDNLLLEVSVLEDSLNAITKLHQVCDKDIKDLSIKLDESHAENGGLKKEIESLRSEIESLKAQLVVVNTPKRSVRRKGK